MLKFSIKGLADGTHAIQATAECRMIADMFPEFFGSIHVRGEVRKLGKRYVVTGAAECDAQMMCDLSGEDFVERIRAELVLSYVANTHLFLEQQGVAEPVQPYYIREDDTEIDLTEEVRQELGVNLPLKRVVPQYRDREFAELFPDIAADTPEKTDNETEHPIDERWAALKNISLS